MLTITTKIITARTESHLEVNETDVTRNIQKNVFESKEDYFCWKQHKQRILWKLENHTTRPPSSAVNLFVLRYSAQTATKSSLFCLSSLCLPRVSCPFVILPFVILRTSLLHFLLCLLSTWFPFYCFFLLLPHLLHPLTVVGCPSHLNHYS